MTVIEERIIRNGRPVTINGTKPRKPVAVKTEPEPLPVPTFVRVTRRTAMGITAFIATASFVLSFAVLTDLAHRAGIPTSLAWLWPLIVDGTIIQVTMAIVALYPYPDEKAATRYFWRVLGPFATISILGNALHAMVPAGPLAPWLAAIVTMVAPISLLVSTHGLAKLSRFKPLPTALPAE